MSDWKAACSDCGSEPEMVEQDGVLHAVYTHTDDCPYPAMVRARIAERAEAVRARKAATR